MELVNPILLARNKLVESALFQEADNYYKHQDLRWFFTYAHATITKLINKNLAAFEQPNALIRLNIHFGEEFIKAIRGAPHKYWKKAFALCKKLEKGAIETMVLVGEAELCAAGMANVHIKIDLAKALKETECISPQDYANILVFVNRGSLAALVKLRGPVIGSAEVIVQHLVAPLLKLEVKIWRNAVYEANCSVSVPDFSEAFLNKLNK